MTGEANTHAEVVFRILETTCRSPDDEEWIVYGLRAEFAASETEVITVEDISAKKDDIQRLVTQLTDYGVTEEHLMDIIEDFVQSLYM